MTALKSTVIVIDDDVSIRESLANLFSSIGLDVQLFSSGPEFLKSGRPESPTCLVLDVRLPDASGLDIVGYYHSHPDHPARPSEFDREHAWPGTSYVIVSVEKGKAVDCRSWRLRDDRAAFDEERLDGDKDR